MKKVVFLDRDGTLNEEVNYLHRTEDLKLLPGVTEGLARLKQAGFKLVVVTNQAGVARGYYKEEDVKMLHDFMNRQLEKGGAEIDAFYYCPHHPVHGVGAYKVQCHCRKPETGMFEQADADLSVDKAHSYMIGDKLLDVQAGNNFGVTSVLVGTGYGKEERKKAENEKNASCYAYYGEGFLDAAEWIITQEKRKQDMKEMEYLEELITRYPVLVREKEAILKAYECLRDCFANGGKLLVAGNGGSCADSEHIVGELMKGFVKRRPVSEELREALIKEDEAMGRELAEKLQGGLPAISLTGHTGLTTAFTNDVDGDLAFAQQLYGYAKAGDVFLGISTSGNSKNVRYALTVAKALGLTTIGLTGKDGGKMKEMCDVAIVVPEMETYKIQELHLPVYHTLCLMLEEHFYEK